MKALVSVAVAAIIAAGLAARPARAQQGGVAREGEVTLIGCVELERDYRARKESGRGGVLGSGVGVGNEFVLTGAKPAARRGQSAGAPAGGDYNITGKLEKDFLRYVGRQVEVIGVIAKADTPMPEINVTLWHPVGDYCPGK